MATDKEREHLEDVVNSLEEELKDIAKKIDATLSHFELLREVLDIPDPTIYHSPEMLRLLRTERRVSRQKTRERSKAIRDKGHSPGPDTRDPSL